MTHSLYNKFVIVTRSRTGSNLLVSMLNNHCDIEAYGEVFARLNNKSPKEVWDATFGMKPEHIKHVGFKIFYYHPLDSRSQDMWTYLVSDKSIKVIHLQRENLLRVYVSRLIAGKTDIWKNESGGKEITSKKVKVDTDEMLVDFKKTQSMIKKANGLFASHSTINISYESLASDKEREMAKVFNFLNVPNQNVASSLKQQNPEKLKDLIINYDDVKGALVETEYSIFCC